MAEPPPIRKFRTLLDEVPRDDHLQSSYDPHVPVLTIAEPNFNQSEAAAAKMEGKPEDTPEAELIVPKYPRRPLKIFRAIPKSKAEPRPLTEEEIRDIALNCKSPKASQAEVAKKIEILIAEIHRLKAQNFGLRKQIKNQAPAAEAPPKAEEPPEAEEPPKTEEPPEPSSD